MRTNIDIDDETLEAAMRAGPFKTKKDAVEAGLKLLTRRLVYQEILALRGKLRWDDAPSVDDLKPAELAHVNPGKPTHKAKPKPANVANKRSAAPSSSRR